MIEREGRLLPFEQFRAEVHDSCAAGGVPVPHLHPRSGTAIAIGGTPVPDPAPDGCGFGSMQGGAGSAVVRLANVTPADAQAWTALTGITLTTAAAVPGDDGTLPGSALMPDVEVVRDAPTVSNTPVWSILIVPLLLLAGVAGGYILANRGATRAPGRPEGATYLDEYEPLDGSGVLRERLTRGHAAMLGMPPDAPPVAVPAPAIDPDPDADPAPAADLDNVDLNREEGGREDTEHDGFAPDGFASDGGAADEAPEPPERPVRD